MHINTSHINSRGNDIFFPRNHFLYDDSINLSSPNQFLLYGLLPTLVHMKMVKIMLSQLVPEIFIRRMSFNKISMNRPFEPILKRSSRVTCLKNNYLKMLHVTTV